MGNLEKNQSYKVTETINEIIKGINSVETVVFCGAGISRDSGLPVVNQLVPYILQKLEVSGEDIKLLLDKDNNPNIPFEAFIESIQDRYDPELIFDIYKQGEPNTNHILLAKLIKEGKLRTIVTTNFDKLIEKALSMEPNSMIQGKDYELLYKEKDFDSIDWNKDQIRLIKIHGSIDDKEEMAITIKQISSQKLSQARFAVIKNVFSTGKHKRVLILGYSSSDVFDLSPQIQAIDENHKLVYYIQHNNISKVESIHEQQDKNPFKRYYGSLRLYYNTGDLIKVIWESSLIKNGPYKQFTNATNWKENIDKWHLQTMHKYSEVFRYVIPASMFFKLGIFKLSLKYYEEALKIANEIGDTRGKEMGLFNLGSVLTNIGEYGKAIEYYEKAIKVAKEIGNRKGEGFGLGSIGTVYKDLGEYRKAIEYYEQALKIAKETKDKGGEGSWLGSLGTVYNMLCEYVKAIEYFELALKIAKEIGVKVMEGMWLGSLGNACHSLGEYKKAIDYCEQALKIAKEIGSRHGVGIWLGSLGSAYDSLGEHRKAIEYYEQALNIAKEIENKINEGRWLGNLGIAYYRLGEYRKAMEYFEQALKIAKGIKDKRGEESWLGNLGNAYQSSGEHKKAIEYFELALKIAKEIEDKGGEGSWFGNLGNAYYIIGEYKKAIDYCEQALKIAKEIRNRDGEGTWLGKLGSIHKSLGEYRKAIEYFEQALKIAKELENKRSEGLCLGNLGISYYSIGENKKAIDCYKQSLNLLIPILGSDHPDVIKIEENLRIAKSKEI